METKLKPYPAYMDSGLDWLGIIPADWKTRRLRYVLYEVDERSEDGKETLLSVSQYTGVTPRQTRADGSAKTRSASLVGYKKAEVGDLVVNIMLAWNGSLGMARQPGIVSPAYGVYRFRPEAYPRYVHYLLRTPLYKSRIRASSTGVVESRLRLYTDDLYDLETILPPVETQRQIAHFLDLYERRVGRLIRAKQRLIALLNEQKQAIIQRAVTRGLDPGVPLKSSGVDWLGDVPAHWTQYRLKNLFQEVDRRTSTGGETLFSLRMHEGLVPHDEVSDKPISNNALIGYKVVQPGEMVMNRMRAATGLFGLVEREGLVSPDYAVFKVSPEAHAAYFVLLFKTRLAGSVFLRESKGLGTGAAGFARLYTDRFGALTVFAPSVDEQRALFMEVVGRLAPLNEAISKASRHLSLIREYRTRLIADVVTGKLDVRGVPLPDDDADLEGVDDIADIDDGMLVGAEDADIDA